MGANDLTFGFRIVANGSAQLVGDLKASTTAMDGLSTSTQTASRYSDSFKDSLSRQNAAMAQTAAAMKQSTVEQENSSSSVSRLLDKYDQQGAKLRKLQSDFTTLNLAAAGGAVGTKDDARLDLVYSKLQQEMLAASGAANVFSNAHIKAGEAAVKGAEGVKTNSTAVRESLVLMREASRGNFTRMAGSASILANALGVMPAILSPVGLGIAAVAAAAIGMEIAFNKGAEESNAMNRALVLTSNFAGQTRGSMDEVAKSMAANSNLTIGSAKQVATEVAASGKISAESYQQVTQLVALYSEATGIAAEKSTAHMIKLFSDPAKGAVELNSTMHFLSVAEINRIDNLQRTGDMVGAQTVLADAYTKKLQEQENELGTLASAWLTVKKAASGYWDELMSAGAKPTHESILAGINEEIANLQNRNSFEAAFLNSEESRIAKIAALEKAAGLQQSIIDDQHAKATKDATAAAENKAAVTANDLAKQITGRREIQQIEDNIRTLKAAQKGLSGPDLALNKEAIAVEQKKLVPKKVKADPNDTELKRIQADAFKAQMQEMGVAAEQIKVYEMAMNGASDAQIKAAQSAADTKIAADAQIKSTKAAAAAQEESAKIIEKVSAADAVQVEQLQFKNSLIGKSALEVQLLTEANKIDLEVKKQIQALDNNPKFATRDKGDGAASNPAVTDAYKRAEDAFKKKGDAAKAGAEIEIKARNDASRSWDVQGTAAIHTYMDNVNNAGRQSAQIFATTFKGAEDTLTKFYQTGKLGATDFVNMISGELARLAAQKTMSGLGSIFSGVGGSSGVSGLASIASMFGFANGGIMTSGGPLPLNAYSNGGIANSPQLALFGEGKLPEAFVPLPDGRSIPVSLTGAAGSAASGVSITIFLNTSTGAATTQTSGSTSSNTSALTQLGKTLAQSVRTVIIQEQRQGGLLAPQAA